MIAEPDNSMQGLEDKVEELFQEGKKKKAVRIENRRVKTQKLEISKKIQHLTNRSSRRNRKNQREEIIKEVIQENVPDENGPASAQVTLL